MHTPPIPRRPADANPYAEAAKVALAATALVALVGPAHAQDVLGASSVKTAVVAVCKVIAFMAVVFGFLRLMSGRHTVEGLVVMGIGALGVAKAEAVAGLLGVS